MHGRKRLFLAAGTLASVGAVVALATGVTFGLFSATQTSSGNNFAAGSVTIGSPLVSTCGVSNMVPGDSGTCTVTANYTGSAPANIAIDVSVAGTVGQPVQAYGGVTPAAAAGLYDPATSNDLVIGLTDNNSTTYDLSGLNSASAGTYTFTFSYSLPFAASNAFQQATSSFTFTVHAAQSGSNASSGTLGSVDNSASWS